MRIPKLFFTFLMFILLGTPSPILCVHNAAPMVCILLGSKALARRAVLSGPPAAGSKIELHFIHIYLFLCLFAKYILFLNFHQYNEL